MFRSAFGIVSLVLLGFGVFVAQGLRAEVIGSEVNRSVEASESGAADTMVGGGTAVLGASELASGSRSGVRRRGFGGEPSTLLLMGLAFIAAAHYARRPTRTHQ
jgi:hypothetical protein